MSSRRFHWNRRTGCAIFAVAMYVSGSACARAAPDDMASSACNSRDTFRIVALGGLFPIPTYLAVNTLPGTSSAPWVVFIKSETIWGSGQSVKWWGVEIVFFDLVRESGIKTIPERQLPKDIAWSERVAQFWAAEGLGATATGKVRGAPLRGRHDPGADARIAHLHQHPRGLPPHRRPGLDLRHRQGHRLATPAASPATVTPATSRWMRRG